MCDRLNKMFYWNAPNPTEKLFFNQMKNTNPHKSSDQYQSKARSYI